MKIGITVESLDLYNYKQGFTMSIGCMVSSLIPATVYMSNPKFMSSRLRVWRWRCLLGRSRDANGCEKKKEIGEVFPLQLPLSSVLSQLSANISYKLTFFRPTPPQSWGKIGNLARIGQFAKLG